MSKNVIAEETRIKLNNGETGILFWNDSEDEEEFDNINYTYISDEDAIKYDGRWNDVCTFFTLQDLIDNGYEILEDSYEDLL